MIKESPQFTCGESTLRGGPILIATRLQSPIMELPSSAKEWSSVLGRTTKNESLCADVWFYEGEWNAVVELRDSWFQRRHSWESRCRRCLGKDRNCDESKRCRLSNKDEVS